MNSQTGRERAERLESLNEQPLYGSLDDDSQLFIRDLTLRYRLTFQELRRLIQIATDLQMWSEPPLVAQWTELERESAGNGEQRKKKLLAALGLRWRTLRDEITAYSPTPPPHPLPSESKRKVRSNEGENEVFGMCPVASEKTVCCNLRTIDAIQGCGFGCSYCSVQTFYEPKSISVETNLAEKLKRVRLDPHKKYHVGSGQSADSLFLGNRSGILTAQLEFAARNPNVLLEFKTKSKNMGAILEADVPANVFVSWSLNPKIIIDNEERLTASLEDRLAAARRVANKGVLVGFHFHPMIHYRGWKEDYTDLIQAVTSTFSPQEVALVSFGTLTFIKPAIKSLRLKGLPSKVLQIPMEETAGKLSYPTRLKEEMFGVAWEAFRGWHDGVFFYLCMESRELWESVFGFCYEDNEAFEIALLDQVCGKIES